MLRATHEDNCYTTVKRHAGVIVAAAKQYDKKPTTFFLKTHNNNTLVSCEDGTIARKKRPSNVIIL